MIRGDRPASDGSVEYADNRLNKAREIGEYGRDWAAFDELWFSEANVDPDGQLDIGAPSDSGEGLPFFRYLSRPHEVQGSDARVTKGEALDSAGCGDEPLMLSHEIAAMEREEHLVSPVIGVEAGYGVSVGIRKIAEFSVEPVALEDGLRPGYGKVSVFSTFAVPDRQNARQIV